MSDIDTVVVDSLKALDLERPIREADKATVPCGCGTSLAPLGHSSIYLSYNDFLIFALFKKLIATYIATNDSVRQAN